MIPLKHIYITGWNYPLFKGLVRFLEFNGIKTEIDHCYFNVEKINLKFNHWLDLWLLEESVKNTYERKV